MALGLFAASNITTDIGQHPSLPMGRLCASCQLQPNKQLEIEHAFA